MIFKSMMVTSFPEDILDISTFNPLPDIPILGSSNSEVHKDMMSIYGQMGIQWSDWVENIVGKGEIARYEQFSFSHNFF